MQFGILEAWLLDRKGFAATLGGMFEIVGGHAAVGFVLGVPILALAVVLSLRKNAGRSLFLLPPLFVLFSLAAITVNLRELRTVLHPASLAWDLGILAAVVGGGLLWSRRRWGKRVDAALGVTLLVANCVVVLATLWPSGDEASANLQAAPSAGDAPHILLFVVDTLRADHLGAYGYPKPTSPGIDEFAGEGLVFERAYAAGNWTRPSMASLHSSTMPSRHGVVAVDNGLSPELPLLSEQLTAMGYLTAFFTNGVNMSPEIGYGRGVRYYDVPQSSAAVERTPVFRGFVFRLLPDARSWVRRTTGGSGPDARNERVLAWARTVDPERPIFLYVHYMGPHTPYMPPAEFIAPFSSTPAQHRLAEPPPRDAGRDALAPDDLEQMIAQYDGEILWHDVHLRRLLEELRRLGWLDNAIVAITSDHGEAFGEHGVWGHGYSLFEEVVRVPLILWSSLSWNRHQRITAPVSLVDLAPTLVDLAGGRIPPAWDGLSLRPWILGERQDDERVVFQEHRPSDRALRNAGWAYIENTSEAEPRPWLYSSSDVTQQEELSARFPSQVREFHVLLQDRVELDSSRGVGATELELDEADLERLRALGYVD